MTEPKFQIGDDLFTRDPSRYIKNARAIIGRVVQVRRIGSSFKYTLDTDRVAINDGTGITEFHWKRVNGVEVFEIDLGYRMGTPLSELSLGNGRTTERFKEIGRSWGYP